METSFRGLVLFQNVCLLLRKRPFWTMSNGGAQLGVVWTFCSSSPLFRKVCLLSRLPILTAPLDMRALDSGLTGLMWGGWWRGTTCHWEELLKSPKAGKSWQFLTSDSGKKTQWSSFQVNLHCWQHSRIHPGSSIWTRQVFRSEVLVIESWLKKIQKCSILSVVEAETISLQATWFQPMEQWFPLGLFSRVLGMLLLSIWKTCQRMENLVSGRWVCLLKVLSQENFTLKFSRTLTSI